MSTVKRRNSGMVALYGVLLALSVFFLGSSLLSDDFQWWEIGLDLLVIAVWAQALGIEIRKPKAEPVSR